MLARKCDRCGKYFTPDMRCHDITKLFKRITIETCNASGYAITGARVDSADLCNECYDKLVKFMENR